MDEFDEYLKKWPWYLFLCLAWTLFAVFPLVSGMFYHSNLPILPDWIDIFRFSLTVLGYGTLGCWLYAMSGQRGVDERTGMKRPTTMERLFGASIINLICTILFTLIAMN